MGSSRVAVQGSKDCVWGWGYLSCVGVLVQGTFGFSRSKGERVQGVWVWGVGLDI